MEKNAVPTGDVIKDWDIREDEKIFFIAFREEQVYNRIRRYIRMSAFCRKGGRGTKTSCRVVGKDMEHVSTDSGISRSTRRQ